MNNKQKYNNEYKKSHYAQMNIICDKAIKDLAKDRAKDLDKSLSQYIVDLILADLDKK